jgi:hypothetical protein
VSNSDEKSPDGGPVASLVSNSRNHRINIIINKLPDDPSTEDSKDQYILDDKNMIRKKLNKLSPEDIARDKKNKMRKEKIRKVSQMHLL